MFGIPQKHALSKLLICDASGIENWKKTEADYVVAVAIIMARRRIFLLRAIFA